nr:hypothetical protein [Tanacetum cinerariifolium]
MEQVLGSKMGSRSKTREIRASEDQTISKDKVEHLLQYQDLLMLILKMVACAALYSL